LKNTESSFIWGEESLLYSFPEPHPMNRRRLESFKEELERRDTLIKRETPQISSYDDLLLFQNKRICRFCD